jgi:hypothetical protein
MAPATPNPINTHLELNLPNVGAFAPHQLRPRAKTASVYFAELFPAAAKQYGCPFVEIRDEQANGQSIVTPVSINVDFFAAALGGDARLGHSIIYYEPEMQFYYREPYQQLYKTTTPEKLMNLYRGLLQRTAQELPAENNQLNLCIEFRSDKTAKAAVQRAKSILAADSSFFSPTSPHQRIRGPELVERIARRFVEEMLTAESGDILLLADAHAAFCAYLKQQNHEAIKRSDFKAVVEPLIRDQFNICLRNDLRIDDHRGVRGWKNVRYAGRTLPT